MTRKPTAPKQIAERVAVVNNLGRYDGSLEAMLKHAEQVSAATKGRSGMFGIGFKVLLPLLERMIQEQADEQ